jgi:hypothetical protein
MSLQTRIASLITAIGADIHSLQTQITDNRIELVTLSRPGALTVAAGVLDLPLSGSYTLVDYRVRVGVAPTGASLIVDINKNGTTLFTTQANRPTIAASALLASTTMPAVTTFVDGDYISLDVDQIGSTVAGSELVVAMRLRRTS